MGSVFTIFLALFLQSQLVHAEPSLLAPADDHSADIQQPADDHTVAGPTPVVPNKFTVCAMVFASRAGINQYEKFFKEEASHFTWKELSPRDRSTEHEDWFDNQCNSGLKCDLLFISGHFGGEFFSDDNENSLTIEQLEEKACSKFTGHGKGCAGIITNPTETYLIGCNTLAAKQNEDPRPTEVYIKMLINDHGFTPYRAEYEDMSHWGPLNRSFQAKMQNVFGGVRHLYGFDGPAPNSNVSVKSFMNDFQHKRKVYGSFYNYFKGEWLKRHTPGAAPVVQQDSYLAHLGLVDYFESRGMIPSDHTYEDYQNFCVATDKQEGMSKRYEAISELMKPAKGHNAMEFFDSYLDVVTDYPIRELGRPDKKKPILTGQQFDEIKPWLAEIVNNATLPAQLKSTAKVISYAPYMQKDVMRVLLQFNWISDSTYKDNEARLNRTIMKRYGLKSADEGL